MFAERVLKAFQSEEYEYAKRDLKLFSSQLASNSYRMEFNLLNNIVVHANLFENKSILVTFVYAQINVHMKVSTRGRQEGVTIVFRRGLFSIDETNRKRI